MGTAVFHEVCTSRSALLLSKHQNILVDLFSTSCWEVSQSLQGSVQTDGKRCIAREKSHDRSCLL